MNRHTRTILSIILIALTTNVFGQRNSAILNGKVSQKLLNSYGSKGLIVRFKKTINKQSQGKPIVIPISSDGSFKSKLALDDSLTYLSLEMINHSSQNKVINLSSTENSRPVDEIYLFQRGDSIYVNIGPNGILTFQGKGSAKLNCQWQIYNIDPLPNGSLIRSNAFIGSKELEKKLLFEDRILNLAIQMRLEILRSYKTQISKQTYDLMYIDAIAYAVFSILKSLHWMPLYFPGQENIKTLENYYDKYLRWKYDTLIDDDKIAAQSGYYADMLFEKEYNYYKLCSPSRAGLKNSFQEIYEQLRDDYNGRLRDKLIYICFERLGKSFMVESKAFINEALNIIQNQTYNQLLLEWKNKQYSAYPFNLTGVDGKSYKLSDFKGKLLILDFWYTGCPNCITLNTAMQPLMDLYEDHKDVIFLSICIDKDRHQWIQSIRSGKYTSDKGLNLYTNGMGRNHPLIENYNITAYPRQMIINNKGELITSSPPRVDSGAEKLKEFKAIIQTVLNDQ